MVLEDGGLFEFWKTVQEPRRNIIADLNSEKFSQHLSQCSVVL